MSSLSFNSMQYPMSRRVLLVTVCVTGMHALIFYNSMPEFKTTESITTEFLTTKSITNQSKPIQPKATVYLDLPPKVLHVTISKPVTKKYPDAITETERLSREMLSDLPTIQQNQVTQQDSISKAKVTEKKRVPPRQETILSQRPSGIESYSSVEQKEKIIAHETLDKPIELVNPRFKGARPIPIYPKNALSSRQQGLVVIRVLINEQGHVEDATVIQSSGSKWLDVSAKNEALRAQFYPYLKNGVAQQSQADLPFNFVLK